MAVTVTVPRLGWSMEEGTFVEWLKHDGDAVAVGEPLFVLEGDKAAQPVESLDAGTLRIGADAPRPGDRVVVGQVIAHLVAGGEALAPVASEAPRSEPAGLSRREEPQEHAVSFRRDKPAGSPPPVQRAGSSPRARRAARERGLDWATLHGTGRNGRVRERDVRAAAPAGGRVVPHSPTRRTIAARMVAGVTQAAPVTLHTRADATNLVNLREQFRSSGATPPGVTDLVVKLTAAALARHPLLQAQWRDDGLLVPDRIDIAVAVDTEAGLLAPVLRGADRLGLGDLSARLRELIDRARAGRLTGDELRDATFTVTNLGADGIDTFTPIVTLPQCAVLGVGRIAREPVVAGDRIVPCDRLALSLTFDHRVVDGAPAARFLAAVRQCIEQPAPWLVG